MKVTKGWLEKICRTIYNELGPYHTESVYQNAMEYELTKNKIKYRREMQVPIIYDNQVIGQGKIDFYIHPKYVIEFKALSSNLITKEDKENQSHYIQKYKSQLIKYLISLNLKKGFLINFNIGAKKELEVVEVINPLLGDDDE
jgi:GxxExxY protein